MGVGVAIKLYYVNYTEYGNTEEINHPQNTDVIEPDCSIF